jgi:predicted Zn-dependent protease
MKFTPRQLSENVNVSKTHPLTEFLWLLGGILVLAGIVFFLLGITTDWAISKTPVSIEAQFGKLTLNRFPAKESRALEKRLQTLLESLPPDSLLHQYHFRVFLSDSDDVNALALPGGNIVVLGGLLKKVKSENELAMVLAHELGHFAHRDHLGNLGRGLGIAVAAALLFGENSAASSLLAKIFLTFQAQYSQQQEAAADQFGLDLLVRRYGHAGGATAFFSRFAPESGRKIPYILASHPHPRDRIAALNHRIKIKNYPVEATRPLGKDLISTNTDGKTQPVGTKS